MKRIQFWAGLHPCHRICHPADIPYRTSHAIIDRDGATETYRVYEVPRVMRGRFLSLRAYEAAGMMVDVDILEGDVVEDTIAQEEWQLDQRTDSGARPQTEYRTWTSLLVVPA